MKITYIEEAIATAKRPRASAAGKAPSSTFALDSISRTSSSTISLIRRSGTLSLRQPILRPRHADGPGLGGRRPARGRDRLTIPLGDHLTSLWSPDGRRIAYLFDANHQDDIHVRLADGSGADQALTDDTTQRAPKWLSSDGRWIISWDREPAGERLVGLAGIAVDAAASRFWSYRAVPG